MSARYSFLIMVVGLTGCSSAAPPRDTVPTPDSGGTAGIAGTGGTGGGGVSGTGGAGVSGSGGAAGSGGDVTGDGGIRDASQVDVDASAGCFRARLLWSEDFESGGYSRWTGQAYGADWGNQCQSNGLSTTQRHSGTTSQRSEVVCTYPDMGNVHRGYGGLQFDGDTALSNFTNQGTGIDAPNGVVNTFWIYVDTDTVFENGRWLGLWTVNSACDWSHAVLTLALEDPSDLIASAHYWAGAGGTREYAPNAPGLPRRAWTRVTVYVNYYDQEMITWQNGVRTSRTTFDRPAETICHWHWGLYASGDNDDIVIYEDDNSIWKLGEQWTDFEQEPYFDHDVAVCSGP